MPDEKASKGTPTTTMDPHQMTEDQKFALARTYLIRIQKNKNGEEKPMDWVLLIIKPLGIVFLKSRAKDKCRS